jgi:hypothetical protein
MRHFFMNGRARRSVRRLLPFIFLAVALPTGLGCALLTPIGLVVDEPEHIARADGLLLGQIMGRQPPGQPMAGVKMNQAVFEVAVSEFPPSIAGAKLPEEVRKAAEAIGWTGEEIFCPTQMVAYFPTFYLPTAVGLGVGRAVGLSPLHTVFFARLCGLLVYLGLGAAALALARFGAGFLFALLTLPTAVNLASSVNQDGVIIGSAVLAAALLTRAADGRGRGARIGAFALLELITIAKLPYAPLLLVCLLPLRRRTWRARALVLGAAMVPPCLWLAYLVHGHFSPWQTPPYHPGRLWPGDRRVWFHDIELAYNMLVFEAHPLQVLMLPFSTLNANWGPAHRSALALIGWLGLPFWWWEYPALAASLIIAALGAVPKGQVGAWRAGDHLIVAAALLLTLVAVYLSAYISFDHAGVGFITGVSGRYFLPFLPFCLFLVPRRVAGPRLIEAVPEALFALPAIALAVVNIVALPLGIFHIFQMPGP